MTNPPEQRRLAALRAADYRVHFDPAARKTALSTAPWDLPPTTAALRGALDAYNASLRPGGANEMLERASRSSLRAYRGRIIRQRDNALMVEVTVGTPLE